MRLALLEMQSSREVPVTSISAADLNLFIESVFTKDDGKIPIFEP